MLYNRNDDENETTELLSCRQQINFLQNECETLNFDNSQLRKSLHDCQLALSQASVDNQIKSVADLITHNKILDEKRINIDDQNYSVLPDTEEITTSISNIDIQPYLLEINILKESLRIVQNSSYDMVSDTVVSTQRQYTNSYVLALMKRVSELSTELAHVSSLKMQTDRNLQTSLDNEESMRHKLVDMTLKLNKQQELFHHQQEILVRVSSNLKESIQMHHTEKFQSEESQRNLSQALHQMELKYQSQCILTGQLTAQVNSCADEELSQIIRLVSTHTDENYDKDDGFLSIEVSAAYDNLNRLVNQLEGEGVSSSSADQTSTLNQLRSAITALPAFCMEHNKMKRAAQEAETRLSNCLLHLHSSRKRCDSLLQYISQKDNVFNYSSSATVAYYKEELEGARNTIAELVSSLLEEKARSGILQKRLETALNRADILELQIIQEGNTQMNQLKCKETALGEMLAYIRNVERSMETWKSCELPALLVSLLNIDGVSQVTFDQQNLDADIDADPAAHININSRSSGIMHIIGESEKAAILAHKLGATKVQLHKGYMKTAYLSECNAFLQNKTSKLGEIVDVLSRQLQSRRQGDNCIEGHDDARQDLDKSMSYRLNSAQNIVNTSNRQRTESSSRADAINSSSSSLPSILPDVTVTPLKHTSTSATSPLENWVDPSVAEAALLGENAELIGSIRQQVASFGDIVSLKDEVDEESEVLYEQRERLAECSRRAADLVDGWQADKANREYVIHALRGTYEEALAAANAALENLQGTSAAQIIRLENMLIKQQKELIKLGAEYSQRPLKTAPKKRASPTSVLELSSSDGERYRNFISPIESWRNAYVEQVGLKNTAAAYTSTSTFKDQYKQLKKKKHTTESYSSPSKLSGENNDSYIAHLEDEVMNLRIFLRAESELRTSFEQQVIALHEQRLGGSDPTGVAGSISDVDLRDYLEQASQLPLDEQNSALRSVKNKDGLITLLNTLRVRCAEELSALRCRDAAARVNNDADSQQLGELCRWRDTCSALQNKLATVKNELSRNEGYLTSFKSRNVSLTTELSNLKQQLEVCEAKLVKCTRSELVKAQLIKDLHKKYEALVAEVSNRELFSLSASEALKKLDVCEAERARLQSQLIATKSKLLTANEQLSSTQEENQRLSVFESKFEQIQSSNIRKDLTSKSYKEVAEKTSAALDEMRREFEKLQAENAKDKRRLERHKEMALAKMKQKDMLITTVTDSGKALERQLKQFEKELLNAREEIVCLQETIAKTEHERQQAEENLHRHEKQLQLIQPLAVFDSSKIPLELTSSLSDLNDIFTALNDSTATATSSTTDKSRANTSTSLLYAKKSNTTRDGRYKMKGGAPYN